jgi:GNAT superfamily N-acetyltransferase
MLDLACQARREGPRALAPRLARRVARAVYAVQDDLVISKDLSEAEAQPADGPFRIEPAGHEHLALAASFNARRCYRRATFGFRQRLERGYSGLVALADGEMVGHIWYFDGRTHPDDPETARYDIALGDGDVYGFDLFIAEDHRGGGKATAFLDQVHATLRSLGYGTMWGYVESDNLASRWLFSIGGHVVVRRRRFARVLSRLLIIDRRVYFEGSDGIRPLLAF